MLRFLGRFNPNLDKTVRTYGSSSFQKKIHELRGNRVWARLLAARLSEVCWDTMETGAKGTFVASLMVEFNTETGGWFWASEGNQVLRRLTVAELLLQHYPILRSLVKTHLNHPDNMTPYRRQCLREKEGFLSFAVERVIDLDRFCQDDGYVAELSRRAGTTNDPITMDAVRATLLALGLKKNLISRAQDSIKREEQDLQRFRDTCALPALIRPHAFKSKQFLLDFAQNKLCPPCDFAGKCKYSITIIIIITIIVHHLEAHPETVVLPSEQADILSPLKRMPP